MRGCSGGACAVEVVAGGGWYEDRMVNSLMLRSNACASSSFTKSVSMGSGTRGCGGDSVAACDCCCCDFEN